jgi:hypothetical protein
MDNVFELLTKGIKLSWDPEELTKDFKAVSDKNNNVISLPGGEPHWQYFDNGIYFSRNLSLAFPAHCKEVINTLTELQNVVKESLNNSYMMQLFANSELRIDRVLLIKVASGKGVKLHFDSTRDYAINIGLKNSNTCLTHIYSGDKIEHLLINEKNIKHTLQMNDGDAYLIATCQPHAVESLISSNDNTDRYLISYCL